MLIEGPLNIAIAEPADGQGKILVIGFQPEFQQLDLAGQSRQFNAYLEMLEESITGDDQIDERNRAGMLIVQQIAEQLLPHIESGDLALEETMTVQIRQSEQVVAITDLLARERR
ncbi:MAG: transcriptional regulator [Chromatiaceae bacterium]|nr:transcriptional regulator [Gammaproteobacteria bacterium]MCP5426731.1 transcriptional regulator [Chromatiaceae bacterium]MCB1862867.1 transcriptional regulator [Gammaproteobacteria bacterium]MCB1870823.1 transcriptional regulator [Gammaproteobacteria bacterium]MCB1880935.1 transcriptional regulator [Gammaproteobacteria bacterium]